MAYYPELNRAQLSYDYLHTNSTTHEFLFGAIVELVDNSRDANSDRCDIFTTNRPELRGGRMLYFADNGCGMSPSEAKAVMTFGFSAKKRDPAMIGQYGNGLKSGAMRIGKDLILFTKRDNVSTCVFLSRTFHEDENIDEVIVPCPSFDKSKQPIANNAAEIAKHKIELDIILKYSPFRTVNDLLLQFEMIKESHGTLIVIYNLKLLENGETELDFISDPLDIRCSDPEGGDISDVKYHPEKQSLRAYLAIIYANPRMKLYIQNKKIRTRRLVSCLLKPKMFQYSSTKFKARVDKQAQEAKDHQATAQDRAKEAESKLADFEKKNGSNPTNKDLRIQWRQLQDRVTLTKQDLKRLKEINEEKLKSSKEPKSLNFIFGINIERRTYDGCFIYNNGRLIRMYEKVGPQLEGTKRCCGVVGVVDIPFVILEPTHNKQDFADSREYRQLLRSMGEHMEQYWKDLNLAAQPGGLVQFWQQFGYVSTDWHVPPLNDEKFIKKRLMCVNLTVQCDQCLKWRTLPYESKQSKMESLDSWTCSQNSDNTCNKCSAPEKVITFPVGKLEKEAVSIETKRDALEKKIQKQQAELSQLSQLSSVKSSKDVSAAESRANQQKAIASVGRIPKKPVQVPPNRKILPNRRRPSPPPSPPPTKKPRTKADLRRQLQSKSTSEEDEEEKETEEEEEDDESDEVEPPVKRGRLSIVHKTPAKKTIPAAAAAKPPPAKSAATPIVLTSTRAAAAAATMRMNTANKSPIVAVSSPPKKTNDAQMSKKSTDTEPKDGTAITVNLDKSAVEKKVAVERLEAHSTNQVNEDSSSQTAVTSSSNGNAALSQTDELIARLRRFLYYFLPPNWSKLTKAQVGKLTPEELISVDLPEFFQAYETGLKKLVADHQRTADAAQLSLRRLRQSSSKVLKLLKPDVNFEAGCETDAVDLAFEKYVTERRAP